MKKVIALATLLAATSAFAGGFGSVEYSSRDGVNGAADSDAVKVTVGTTLTNNVAVDLSSRFAKQDGVSTNNSTRLEAGVTGSMPLGNGVTLYTRGAVGEKYTSSDNFSYYSVEPGIKYQLTPALSAKVGYRYRDAFTNSNGDQTRTWRLGTEYALSKQYSVGLGFDRVRGDSEYNAVNVSLGIKF